MIDWSANGPCLSVDLPQRKIGVGLGSGAKALSHSFCYPVMNGAPQVLGLSILVDYLKPQKVCVYNEILSLIASLLIWCKQFDRNKPNLGSHSVAQGQHGCNWENL